MINLRSFIIPIAFIILFLLIPVPKIYAGTLTCNDDLTNKIMISEFSEASSTEWVELLDGDQDNSINLSGCSLVMTPTNGDPVTKILSGTLPRQGFLTVNLETNSMDNSGGKLEFKDAAASAVYTLSYGSFAPQASIHISDAPLATESAWINPSAQPSPSWLIDHSAPTKGWCNPAGFNGCPSVSTITSSMSSDGVTTNLGEMSDFTHTSSLYFEKTGQGRIAFSSEINFTDRDALSWMSTLDQKLSFTNGTISLDADLINNLVNTQATLTMYGLNYNNPKVLVNGADDTGGVVSGLTYNREAGTLTFTAAHFTTFQAVENTAASSSSSSSSSSPAQAPGCGDMIPYKAPLLYQINTTAHSADLYFVPAGDPVSHHFIIYGYSNEYYRFGTRYDVGHTTGAIKYTINHLSPNTTYYFKILGANGCAASSWSNTLSAKTNKINRAVSSQYKLIASATSKPTDYKIGKLQSNKNLAGASFISKINKFINGFFN